MKRDVVELANLNYAREPIFAKDRSKIRNKLADIEALMRKLALLDISPALTKLDQARTLLSDKARELEQQSERLASEYLNGSKSHEKFQHEYLEIRKQSSKTRILADRLTEERNRLVENVPSNTMLHRPVT